MISQHVRTVVDDLDYDFQQFEVQHFIRHLERKRGRPIICQPYDFAPGLTGLWIPAETADYIFYTQHTHPIHQVHITLHEVAHLLLGHPCQRLQQVLAPELLHVSPQTDVQDQWTGEGKDFQEKEAEAFVYLIQQRIVAAQRLEELTHSYSSIEGLDHFTDTLGLVE